LSANGVAVIEGESAEFRYRLIQYETAFDWSLYILYAPNLSPCATVESMRLLHVFNKNTDFLVQEPIVPTWVNRAFPADRNLRNLIDRIPLGSIPIGAGSQRLAWLMPNNGVAVIGPNERRRSDCPYLIQPIDSVRVMSDHLVGRFYRSWRLSTYPYAETGDITDAEILELKSRMEADGWFVDDWKRINVGRLVDGSIVRLDAENLQYRRPVRAIIRNMLRNTTARTP
jgi:hypothetical protein